LRCFSLVALFVTAALQAAPGLQVRIMLERVDHSVVLVCPSHEFHSGDHIRLRVTVSQPMSVYVRNKTELDFCIDPAALRASHPGEIILGPMRLYGGEVDLGLITFDDSAGIEHIYIVAASRPDEPPTLIEMALRHAQ
jgi:hypothetical protein